MGSSGGRFCDLPGDALALADVPADDFTAAARLVARHARDDDDRALLLRVLGLALEGAQKRSARPEARRRLP